MLDVFVPDMAGSARISSSTVAEFTRLLSDPFLAASWLWLAGITGLNADVFQAVPLLCAVAAWALRSTAVDALSRWSDRLAGRSIETAFQSRQARQASAGQSLPRWGRRFRRASVEESEPAVSRSEPDFASMGEYARLIPTSQTVNTTLEEGEHRLAPIGFDSETRIQIIGRYELLQELSRGPMGVVYKAYDLQIGRGVVVKLLHTAGMDEEELRLKKQRLLKEARAAGKLVHAGLVTIFDVSEDERGNPYIVMEHVEGETLEEALSPRLSAGGGTGIVPHHGKPPLSLQQRLDVAIEITLAVEHAHRHGIIHRDLKPSNVLLTPDLHAKIVDFGIARLLELNRARPQGVAAGPQGQVGGADEDDGVPGTPEFVAPELLNGMAAGRASDIFSLGVMLYWIFTGELPFSGRSVTEITYNVAHNQPAPVRQLNWALPSELDALLHRCLAKEPGARYANAGELAAELQAIRYAHLAPPAVQQQLRSKAG